MTTTVLITGLIAGALGGCGAAHCRTTEGGTAACETAQEATTQEPDTMQLGNFSVSLSVKDLAVSKAFYEKLGFQKVGGDDIGYLIMQNETATIGLFQGMFEGNILTFNPGWDRNTNTLDAFDDVRNIQQHLKQQGISLIIEADESSTGPASLVFVDPDGNQILIDQHVAKPESDQ